VHAHKAKLMLGQVSKTDRLDARGLSALARCQRCGSHHASYATCGISLAPGCCWCASAHMSAYSTTGCASEGGIKKPFAP